MKETLQNSCRRDRFRTYDPHRVKVAPSENQPKIEGGVSEQRTEQGRSNEKTGALPGLTAIAGVMLLFVVAACAMTPAARSDADDAEPDAGAPNDAGLEEDASADAAPPCSCVDAGECMTATCIDGECVYAPKPEGSPAFDQPSTECSFRECDGHGGEQFVELCDAGHE